VCEKSLMNQTEWDSHYQTHAAGRTPHALISWAVQTFDLKPGRALDLACGSGRNALWLAWLGWEVTAVDRSPEAMRRLNDEASRRNLHVNAETADLETAGFTIQPAYWDLIVCCLYLQRDLFEPIKRGVKPGGSIIAAVLVSEQEKPFRAAPGELRSYFTDWEILHFTESADTAEVVVRKPVTSPAA